MSLLLVESGRSYGGTERVVWELATRLPPERFAPRVWLSPSSGLNELATALREADVPVERVPEVDSRWAFRDMVRTWRALRRARPTILHMHHVWPTADRYLSELAVWAGVPHQVVTEHLAGESHSASQRTLKRRELRRASAVTTVSRAVADSLAQDLQVPRERFMVVPNGADRPREEEERPEARRLRAEMRVGFARPLLVAVGRLEEQKGHLVLLEAASRLRALGLDFVLAVAGQGSLAGELAERARQLGLEERIRWMGQLEEPGPLLLAADVFVLPSRWEGMPLTLLEAMARGRAVVASGVGGVPEVVVDGVNGLLVPPGDPEVLTQALGRLCRAPAERELLGEEAAETVRSTYTWERVVEGFEAVYDEVLGLTSFDPMRQPTGRAGSKALGKRSARVRAPRERVPR